MARHGVENLILREIPVLQLTLHLVLGPQGHPLWVMSIVWLGWCEVVDAYQRVESGRSLSRDGFPDVAGPVLGGVHFILHELLVFNVGDVVVKQLEEVLISIVLPLPAGRNLDLMRLRLSLLLL